MFMHCALHKVRVCLNRLPVKNLPSIDTTTFEFQIHRNQVSCASFSVCSVLGAPHNSLLFIESEIS